jgi:hypothetical protein
MIPTYTLLALTLTLPLVAWAVMRAVNWAAGRWG